jgi:hypothetical protein
LLLLLPLAKAGLAHVMRLTNLMRKAHCILAKAKRDNGRPVNLQEHRAAARNAGGAAVCWLCVSPPTR